MAEARGYLEDRRRILDDRHSAYNSQPSRDACIVLANRPCESIVENGALTLSCRRLENVALARHFVFRRPS